MTHSASAHAAAGAVGAPGLRHWTSVSMSSGVLVTVYSLCFFRMVRKFLMARCVATLSAAIERPLMAEASFNDISLSLSIVTACRCSSGSLSMASANAASSDPRNRGSFEARERFHARWKVRFRVPSRGSHGADRSMKRRLAMATNHGPNGRLGVIGMADQCEWSAGHPARRLQPRSAA